ncbi:MAG: chorismate-binding protein [Corynebacterium sp.]|nr:chorismate-binding protein [Corynebacterium sp.]
MRILIVDNHDSFTFNLVEYVRAATGTRPTVAPNDAAWEVQEFSDFDAAIISPGPGHPENAADLGLSAKVIESFSGPLLGVCLGMQAMVHLDGGSIERLSQPAHGVRTEIEHNSEGIFSGLESPLHVVRYHSLHASCVPNSYRVTAAGDGIVMAIEHQSLPRWGVQFHPESMSSESGNDLINNFLHRAREHYTQQTYCLRHVKKTLDPEQVVRCFPPHRRFWFEHNGLHIVGYGEEVLTIPANDPSGFVRLQKAIDRVQVPAVSPLSGCSFALGWVGYLGYEMGRGATAAILPTAPVPDAEFVFATRAIIIDPAAEHTYLLSFANDADWNIPDVPTMHRPAASPPDARAALTAAPVHQREDYLQLIARAQDHMFAGNSYEVCLTNRYEMEAVPDMLSAFADLFATYATGRSGFLDLPGQQLASVTPELFLQVDGNRTAVSRPIKGTRPRGHTAADDARLRAELFHAKETSELLMAADMVRHDLSHVCHPVTRNAEFYAQSFPTVHQLMVDIVGRLEDGFSPVDATAAAFPGASMTGAPKDRTMAIIAGLESTWRGAYSGCFGFFSITGEVDLSMTIRTLVNVTDQFSYYGVGGAILAVSDPDAEWDETQVKLAPLLSFLEQKVESPQWN